MIRRRMAGIGAGLWVAAWVAWPSISSACAVCTAGRDEENAFAFLMTTIFMSLMPLIAIGSLVYFLWRRIRKLEEEREAQAGDGAARPPIRGPEAEPRVAR